MSYLDDLDGELRSAGIPGRRRSRIVSEFGDHLHEDPAADLGAPRDLARQFADELGTRLARDAAFRVFGALAFAGITLVIMFVAGGQMRTVSLYGEQRTATPGWAAPILLVGALAAQVALAAGGLALLRAWRLRRERVISAAEATVLARRSAFGLVGGILTLLVLPACALAFPNAAGSTWTTLAWVLAAIGVAALVATVPVLLAAIRLRPHVEGRAGDLVDDLGMWAPASLTPGRCAVLLAAMITVVLTAAGLVTYDPYDGALRGLVDAAACLTGFVVLGRYLGLRRTG